MRSSMNAAWLSLHSPAALRDRKHPNGHPCL